MLIANHLKKYFALRSGMLGGRAGEVKAVDDVSFSVRKGETLGIVGESGCGKSTLARLLMHLIPMDEGEMIFDGDPVGTPSGLTLRELRRDLQMVFQDSYSSLNPRLPVQDSIAYGPRVHGMDRISARDLARGMLDKVGLRPDLFGARYPHELSGGQRQRINIARALALSPRMLILDEAVSALDKSVEAQVLNLLRHLKRDFNLTYLFISHDLAVVRHVSDRVLVMYLGQIVEIGPVDAIYDAPRHPYSKALLDSRLALDPGERIDEAPITGDPPNPANPPSGCRFRTRCPFAESVCSTTMPTLGDEGPDAHLVACHMMAPGSGHSRAAGRTGAQPCPVPAL
ncbi:MAG TPA: oligopeptide/dipeptide ABC transporter ATP-binding protein [Alphaproteobacteria bacterium]